MLYSYLRRRSAEHVADTRWIAEVSADGRILVGADRNIVRNPLERRAICLACARYIVFSNNNTPVHEMVDRFERHVPRIAELAKLPGPWVYRIAKHGIERLFLDCDRRP
ncbi:PIN-like domain-containing protein [Saccharomonospora iraqiensis]|uniref:PIN-like domain-containing protein n=1 Tax=Saccharomonospora iraqiensis TaxID=52698 RepID=UPI000479F294|nr:hypothetical protein [Saccharomonospora iraqiensis]